MSVTNNSVMPPATAPRSLKHPPTPPQQPTPQATLSHLPPTLLPLLAEAANVPLTSLSTLCSPRGTSVYNAVVDYVAISAPTASLYTDHSESEVESDSEEEEDETPKPRRAPIPSFEMGLGVAYVQWPPAPKLTAAALAEARGAKPCPQKEVKGDDGDIFTVSVANYSIGEPAHNGNELDTLKEVVIACDSAEKLKKFAREICVWQQRRWGQPRERIGWFSLQRFRTGDDAGWYRSSSRKRPKESVILPDGMMDDIVADVRRFLSPKTKRWYEKHGLPQRRTYLLYGPPGTGKRSVINVLASVFNLCCCYLSMTNSELSSKVLADALGSLPYKPLIVLEDVDVLSHGRDNVARGKLTFPGVLDALDGLVSVEGGAVAVMTSNHIERMDEEKIRAGRVDRRFLFGPPTDEQIRGLFLSFYPDAEEAVVDKFLKAVLNRSQSEARNMATLRELFIKMRDFAASECADGVDDFFNSYTPPERETDVGAKESVVEAARSGSEEED